MSWSLERLRDPASCERLIRDTNAFIARAYTRENTIARRNYVFQFTEIESFAFALHCPGGPETRHLPGFGEDEVPPALMVLSREVVDRLSLKRGRVLWNVGRYVERCGPIQPHFDGELFEYSVDPGVSHHVRSGIRPREVALLTLRDDTENGGTRLHDALEREIAPPIAVGDLLRFDNVLHRHSVPDPVGPEPRSPRGVDLPSRWIRYTMGWRSLEDDCFDWRDDRPLERIALEDAIALHERFLRETWPAQIQTDLARATFPHPERHT
jgi:hypothetical protein